MLRGSPSPFSFYVTRADGDSQRKLRDKFRKSEAVINSFRPYLSSCEKDKIAYMRSNDDDIGSQELVCASFREKEGAVTALHPDIVIVSVSSPKLQRPSVQES